MSPLYGHAQNQQFCGVQQPELGGAGDIEHDPVPVPTAGGVPHVPETADELARCTTAVATVRYTFGSVL